MKNIISMSIEFQLKNGSHASSRRCHELLFLDDKHHLSSNFACFKLSPMILRIAKGENLHSHTTTAPSLEVRIQRKRASVSLLGSWSLKGLLADFFAMTYCMMKNFLWNVKSFLCRATIFYQSINWQNHSLLVLCSTLNWNLALQSKVVKIIMHLNAIWIVRRILFENNFPFFYL